MRLKYKEEEEEEEELLLVDFMARKGRMGKKNENEWRWKLEGDEEIVIKQQESEDKDHGVGGS